MSNLDIVNIVKRQPVPMYTSQRLYCNSNKVYEKYANNCPVLLAMTFMNKFILCIYV